MQVEIAKANPTADLTGLMIALYEGHKIMVSGAGKAHGNVTFRD